MSGPTTSRSPTQAPSEYWPQEVADKRIERARLVRQEEWHALPAGWFSLRYDEFLHERRSLMARVTHEGFKRLADPNYEPDLTRPDATDARHPLTLLSLESLVISGQLPPGTLLTPVDPNRDTIAEVLEDGYIQVGEHTCESVDRAAREDHADVDSGWYYWLAHLDGQTEPVLLADLREQASAELGDGA